MDLVVPLVSAALGAAAGVISAVAVKRSSVVSVSKTVTFDANRCFDQLNNLERRINEVADENRELRGVIATQQQRIGALEVWVRSQGHDPDLITLAQLVRDAHMDLDKEQ